MLDWLKTILGEQYSEDIDKRISDEIGKGFVSRTDFNAANEAKKQLEAQIADRDKQLADIKKQSGDAATLKDALAKAEADNKAAAEAHKADMARLRKISALQLALSDQTHDPDDVISRIDLEKIELGEDGGPKTKLDDFIKPIRESKPYLFKEQEAKPPEFKGAKPADPGAPPKGDAPGGPVIF